LRRGKRNRQTNTRRDSPSPPAECSPRGPTALVVVTHPRGCGSSSLGVRGKGEGRFTTETCSGRRPIADRIFRSPYSRRHGHVSVVFRSALSPSVAATQLGRAKESANAGRALLSPPRGPLPLRRMRPAYTRTPLRSSRFFLENSRKSKGFADGAAPLPDPPAPRLADSQQRGGEGPAHYAASGGEGQRKKKRLCIPPIPGGKALQKHVRAADRTAVGKQSAIGRHHRHPSAALQ